MAKMEWKQVETVDNKADIVTWRARIRGGWLVTTWAKRTKDTADGKDIPGGSNWGGGVTFVRDPKHLWDVDEHDKPT